MRLLILTDLSTSIGDDQAVSPTSIATAEVVDALIESAHTRGDLAIDVVARHGSAVTAPLITVDPHDLGTVPQDNLNALAAQEAMYIEVALSGLLDGYTVVHSLAPVVAPLQMLARGGAGLVQTVLTGPEHPAAVLPKRLLGDAIRSVTAWGERKVGRESVVPVSVDFDRYGLAKARPRNVVLWSGSETGPAWETTHRVLDNMGLRLQPLDSVTPETYGAALALLAGATTLESCGPLHPLRSLACGVPVVAFEGSGTGWVIGDDPIIGSVVSGVDVEIKGAISKILAQPDTERARVRRRQRALALATRSAMTARYRNLYDEVLRTRPGDV